MSDKKIESIIAKAGLTEQEKKVARVYYDSKSAGKKTRLWVDCLSSKKFHQLLENAREKIEPFLNKRAGK